MSYLETSAKTGINVAKAFTTIVEEMKQRYDDGVYQTFYPRSTTLDRKNSVTAGWLWPCAR